VILLGGSTAEVRLRTHQLASWSAQPLLFCADVEEGVGQRFEGASWLPPPMSVGRIHAHDPEAALALAAAYGRCTAREARQLGLNWILAPVCDVNNNPANPVINVRAWGEDPGTVSALTAAFIAGRPGRRRALLRQALPRPRRHHRRFAPRTARAGPQP
jgi:beta-glucosidase